MQKGDIDESQTGIFGTTLFVDKIFIWIKWLRFLLTLRESTRSKVVGSESKFQEAICAFANDLPNSRKNGYLRYHALLGSKTLWCKYGLAAHEISDTAIRWRIHVEVFLGFVNRML